MARSKRARKSVSLAKSRKDDEDECGRGDLGPKSRAYRLHTVVEMLPEDKNGRKRRRRVHPLEAMSGKLSQRQRAAGEEICNRYEATLTGPPAINENPVDSTPDYDAIVTGKTEVLRKYAWIMQPVPGNIRPVVLHVCCEGRYLRDGLSRDGHDDKMWTAQLMVGLDLVANRMGL